MKLLRAWAESSGKIIVKITVEGEMQTPFWGEPVKLHGGCFLFNSIDCSPNNIVRFRVNELHNTIEVLRQKDDDRVVSEFTVESIGVFDEDYNEIERSTREYELDKNFSDLLDYKKSKEYFDGKVDEVKIYDKKIDNPKERYSIFSEHT